MKVVMVVTSADKLGDHETGLWLEELAAAYYIFEEAGYEIVISSPKGGACPIDAASLGDGFFTDDCKKFMHDGKAVGKLCHSVPLSSIPFSEGGVDLMYIAGGHGCSADFVSDDNNPLKDAVETLVSSSKVVTAVCHGVTVLSHCKNADGTPLLKGKTVTGFSNSEEEAVQLTKLVPYLIETKFKELGATYESGGDWTSKVVVDGNLITGQNPQSSADAAKKAIEVLKAK